MSRDLVTGGGMNTDARAETTPCAHATTFVSRERAISTQIWFRPAGYETPPHLVRAIGASVETLCEGRWSVTERMEAFIAPKVPCGACRAIDGQQRIEIGLDELVDNAPMTPEEEEQILAMERDEHLRALDEERRRIARERPWAFEFDIEQDAISEAYARQCTGEGG
jgi:hypothetical protein